MEKDQLLKSLKELKSNSQKRNFKQTIDLIVNLKGLDLKKPEHQVDFFAALRHDVGKKKRVCALVGAELADEAKKNCDLAIMHDDFDKYMKDKKLAKKVAQQYDFFIAQANIMPKVATAFGKALGPKGKMPNPKAGCVVPPKTSLKPLYEKLQLTQKISAKIQPIVQCMVGNEDSKDDDVAENILDIMKQLEAKLPQGKNNLRSAFIKFTMGKPVKIL